MDERIKAHMALVDEFATTTAVVAVGRDRALNTQSQTEEAIEARNAVEASARQLAEQPQQAEEILQSLGWTCINGVWTEDRAATATLAPQQAEPIISTEHGPWIPSKYSAEEGEKYCQRCLMRDKFLGAKDCTPHIVYPTPSAPTAEPDERAEFEAWIAKDGGDLSMFGNPPHKHYKNRAVMGAWEAWQARASKGKP